MGRGIDAERCRLQVMRAEDAEAELDLKAEVGNPNRRIDDCDLRIPCASPQKPRLRT
jgi:hypothetical protein